MPWCCANGSAHSAATLHEATPLHAESRHDADDDSLDRWGPMLLRARKTALFVSASPAELPLLEQLRFAGWSVQATLPSLANSAFTQLRPLLVLLDARLPDCAAISKSLHALSTNAEDVFFVAVTDRSLGEKRRRSLTQADILHVVQSTSRDVSLFEFVARLLTRIRAVPALFAVLDEAEQAIEVCDEDRYVQYVNRAYENATGCMRSEVLGEVESDTRRRSLPKTRVDELPPRRFSHDWHCLHVPASSSLKSSSSPPATNPQQFVYLKRRSADAVMCRDMSLKSVRSQSGLVEAPISEVLTLLRDAASCVESETSQHLVRDAIRLLSSQELYAPSITRFRDNDRIATQYYDGLVRPLQLHHPNRQRKRSVVDAYREKRGGRRISADVKNALQNEHSWHFDVLQLEKVSEHRPLTHLGMKLFERWKVAEALQCSEDTLKRWLACMEAHYRVENAYHNATHAADVLQATSFFLNSPNVAKHVNEMHAVSSLIAAAVHDLDHPGRGNAFLINTRQSLALLYNDQSVLENHHVALAFQLTLQPSNNVNIFANLSRDEFVSYRQSVVDMVLATDMCRHFEYLTKFQHTVLNLHEVGEDSLDSEGDASPEVPADASPEEEREGNSMSICRMLIKCADIANPTRDWALCQRWAMRIVSEYFDQTAEEREKGLPLTMELFDRDACNVPLTQCGFIDMFAREAFSCWTSFADLPHLLQGLEENYERWKAQTSSWTPANNHSLL